MNKKYILRILTVIIVGFVLVPKVYGEKINMYHTFYGCGKTSGSESGCPQELAGSAGDRYIFKNINGTVNELDRIQVGNNIAFCIEVGANLQTRDNTIKESKTLAEYLNVTLNDMTKSNQLANKINEYAYFGQKYYNSESNGQDYYAAAQVLIWNELYKNGFRTNSYTDNLILKYGLEAN